MRRLLAAVLATAALALPAALPTAALAHADPSHRVPHAYANAVPAGHWQRGDRHWWRGRAEWRGYRGPLRGLWFMPGAGYYPAPPGDHQWRRGQYLPEPWRHNYVRDGAWFELRSPPRGYAWVWCGDQIALVSQGSGLILDVVPDAL